MNFMDKIECTDTEVELKYCERCGGLFLRLLGANLVYCAACMSQWATLSSTTHGTGDVQSWARRKLRTLERDQSRIETGNPNRRSAGSVATEVRPC
jgi:hypothetical protein